MCGYLNFQSTSQLFVPNSLLDRTQVQPAHPRQFTQNTILFLSANVTTYLFCFTSSICHQHPPGVLQQPQNQTDALSSSLYKLIYHTVTTVIMSYDYLKLPQDFPIKERLQFWLGNLVIDLTTTCPWSPDTPSVHCVCNCRCQIPTSPDSLAGPVTTRTCVGHFREDFLP
jgi:hypothetical protein